ncbi:MAG: hypothetical protein ABSB35_42760 [Bryobacteraceae bacterium]|jgi:hypothetical protein
MERLNYFNPYQSKGAWHEDQLTRAFLVVVRMVPLALSAFLDLIRDRQTTAKSERPLPSLSDLLVQDLAIHTQKEQVPQTTGRLISVVMTDEHWPPESPVQQSDRGARYDGVLCFDPDWIIVIENKPLHVNIWADQVNPSLPLEGHEIVIDPRLVVLQWGDVVNRLTALLDVNWLGSTDRQLVSDFLDFLDEQFEYLNPYDTFGRCKDSMVLLHKRCEKILEAIAPGQVKWQGSWSTHYFELKSARQRSEAPVKRCALYPKQSGEDVSIELAMYPGDTMNQARSFYKYLSEYGATPFLNLKNQGWSVKTNFHFGFFQKGFGHGVKTTLSVEDYLRYWGASARPIEQILPDEHGFESSLRSLVADGLIAESDVLSVSTKAVALGAINLNVIPGVEVIYRWSLADAAAIDKKKDGMVEEVRRKTNEAIATWGGVLVTWGGDATFLT